MQDKMSSRFRFFFGVACLAVLTTACKPTPTTVVEPPAADSPQGYVQQVEAKGFVIKGMEATDWTPYQRVRYDSAGREIERDELAELAAPRYTTTYDEKGRKVKLQRKGQDRAGDIDYTTVWSADGLQSTEEEYIHREEKLIARVITRMDSAGKILDRTALNLQFPEYGVDTQRTAMIYDTEGRLVEERESFRGKTIPSVRYTYNKIGHLVQVERYDADGNVSRTEAYEVDGEGRKTALRVTEQGNPTQRLERRFTWTAGGKLQEELLYTGDCSAAGEQSGKCMISETIRYTYDAEGRILTKDIYILGKSEPAQQLRYRYEPFKQ
jgi:hypothetical protein